MQLQISKQSGSIKWYALLLAICLIAYWPVAFGVFSVKNDALHYFLPFRYNISSAIRDGEFPFWSPFIYLGYPLHGDMQSGAWNPFVWLLSLFGRYDLTLFHIENLVYIFLSGIGMFKLSRLISDSGAIRLFAAASFMLSGYMFGSGQFINWIASAAFIPFIIYYYHQFLTSGNFFSAIATGIFCWLLLVCGYPADVIYVSYLLVAMLLAGVWYMRKKLRTGPYLKKYTLNHLLIMLVFIGLSAPALISYAELLPYYTRGSGASFEQSVQNSYEIKNTISFLNPWPVTAQDFQSATDPTGRNIFTGIFVLIFSIYSLFSRWTSATKFLFIVLLFSLFFSLGDGFFVRKAAYYILPGMNSFRHPSHFRLYVLLPMILLACMGLKDIIKRLRPDRYFYFLTLAVVAICLVIAALAYTGSMSGVIAELPGGFSGSRLKQVLYSLNKDSLLFTGCLLQVTFILILLLTIRKKFFSVKTILVLHLVNLFIFQSLFPVNFVSKTNPAVINRLIDEAHADHDPAASVKSLLANSGDAFKHFDELGLSYFYSEKVGISKITNTPSFLASLEEFLRHDSLYNKIAQKPVAYLTDRTGVLPGNLDQIRISYNSVEIETASETNSVLNLTQNFNHNWKAEVDGRSAAIQRANIAFMSLPLQPGKHMIRWSYSPRAVYIGLVFFCITIVYLVILLFRYTATKKQQ